VNIELGAMADDISKQLADAGYEAIGKSADLLDRLANAITLTHIHGCITDAECRAARKRLIKQIQIKRIEPKEQPE